MKEFKHFTFLITLFFGNLMFAADAPNRILRLERPTPYDASAQNMPVVPEINPSSYQTRGPLDVLSSQGTSVNCPPSVDPCFIAGFFVATDVFNVPKVGSNFSVIFIGTEIEDGITLGLYAITYCRPFCCPVSVVAFSSGISVSGDLEDCGTIVIDRPVEVRSSTRGNAVLRAPLGVNVAFKAIPIT